MPAIHAFGQSRIASSSYKAWGQSSLLTQRNHFPLYDEEDWSRASMIQFKRRYFRLTLHLPKTPHHIDEK
jgi:hypothetical protein